MTTFILCKCNAWWACGLFSGMIEVTRLVEHVLAFWQWCNFPQSKALDFRVIIYAYWKVNILENIWPKSSFVVYWGVTFLRILTQSLERCGQIDSILQIQLAHTAEANNFPSITQLHINPCYCYKCNTCDIPLIKCICTGA